MFAILTDCINDKENLMDKQETARSADEPME